MIKVLIINTVWFRINGMSNIIMNYYKYMDKSEISCDFVINDEINEMYMKQLNNNYFMLHNRKKKPFSYIKKLSGIIKKGNYDIVHIHGNSALMQIELEAIRKSGIDCKKIVHAHNTSCKHKLLNNLLYKKFLKSYDFACACSDEAGKWLFKDNKYIVMNNGVETSRFVYNAELRKELRNKNKCDDKFILLHVGVFNEQKNHTFLIDVFKAVLEKEPTAELRLVGRGIKFEEIKNKVKQLDIEKNVIFVGETTKPELEYLMADVFVFPSIFESFGLVAVEAQCCGLPCVVSDALPLSVKVNDEFDFLSLQKSPQQWADEILKYKDYNGRRSCEHRVTEQGYSIVKEANRLTEFYKSVSEK